MARNNKLYVKVLRGILGPISGSISGISFTKNGQAKKKTSLNKFPATRKLFLIRFKKFPKDDTHSRIITAYSCHDAFRIIRKYFPLAIFISCHQL